MSNPGKGQAPDVYFDIENKELAIKIVNKVIADLGREIKEDEIRNTKHKKAMERESLSKGLPGKEVPEESGGAGSGIPGENDDVNPSSADEEHSME